MGHSTEGRTSSSVFIWRIEPARSARWVYPDESVSIPPHPPRSGITANRYTPNETAGPRRSRQDDIKQPAPLFQHSIGNRVLLLLLLSKVVQIRLKGHPATIIGAFVSPVAAPGRGNVPPQARVSTRGVGKRKGPMESGQEVIPQPGVWDAELQRGKQELDDVVLQAA
jgi:hypothetical protein